MTQLEDERAASEVWRHRAFTAEKETKRLHELMKTREMKLVKEVGADIERLKLEHAYEHCAWTSMIHEADIVISCLCDAIAGLRDGQPRPMEPVNVQRARRFQLEIRARLAERFCE